MELDLVVESGKDDATKLVNAYLKTHYSPQETRIRPESCELESRDSREKCKSTAFLVPLHWGVCHRLSFSEKIHF